MTFRRRRAAAASAGRAAVATGARTVLTACALASATLVLGPGARATALEDELSSVDMRVKPGVVAVHSVRAVPGYDRPVGKCAGSGVILSGGLIATTLSVAGPGDEIEVRYSDDRRSPAEVVSCDPIRELVLIRPDMPGGTPLELGLPDQLHADSWVFLVGFTLSSPEPSLVTGRFSSRSIINLTDSPTDTVELLQLEANVFPGNSGAAVVDAEGRLVGVILGGLGSDGFLDPVVLSAFGEEATITQAIMTAHPPHGISFALPADDVDRLARETMDGKRGPKSYLGIRVSDRASGNGDVAGVFIEAIVNDSPASRAGLRRGDLIVAVDDVPVPTPDLLGSILSSRGPGTTARVEVASTSGARRTTPVVLGDYTADYRMRVVWARLLAGRESSLASARARLARELSVLDAELERVGSLMPDTAGN